MIGSTNAARAFVLLAALKNYVQGRARRLWINEFFESLKPASLDALVQAQDQKAAQVQTVRVVHENSSSYALRRDLRYGTRSRKWLMTRGLNERMDAYYEQWAAFARRNNDTDLTVYTRTDPNQLKDKTFEELMP